MKPLHRTRLSIGLLTAIALILAGCRSPNTVSASDIPASEETQAGPSEQRQLFTSARDDAQAAAIRTPLVASPQADAAGFRPSFGASGSRAPAGAGPSPTPIATATPEAAPTRQAPEYVEAALFEDELDASWSLDQSSGVTYDLYDTSHWFSEVDPQRKLDSGAVTIAATPLEEFGTLHFSVRKGARTAYPRDEVLGISMWINSGSDILDTDDLSVTVIGSNDLPYWSPDDYSVFADVDEFFSETRLYYLGLNRAIPPDTWAHVVVWLDDLEFDPHYEFVTGFYIKNDAGFSHTYYVDNVSLLTLP